MVVSTLSLQPSSLSCYNNNIRAARNRTFAISNVVLRSHNNVINSRTTTRKQRILPVLIRAASSVSAAPTSQDEPNNHGSRILFSDVVVQREYKKPFWSHKWSGSEIALAGCLLVCHLLCLCAPFVFNWAAFWVAAGLYVVTGLFGITLCYHRVLTHKSFKIPKWLEYIFAYCGILAGQMDPIFWVSVHRYHHQHCDSEKDPHSPTEGLWFSHMSWAFDVEHIEQKCGELGDNVGDLKQQPFYRFIQQTYFLHMMGIALPLYALGGFPFVVWGLGVRLVWVLHITLLVNSASHIWGNQTWKTGDHSKNNWWVALLSFGEGWHNNHHAFEYSARHGLDVRDSYPTSGINKPCLDYIMILGYSSHSQLVLGWNLKLYHGIKAGPLHVQAQRPTMLLRVTRNKSTL